MFPDFWDTEELAGVDFSEQGVRIKSDKLCHATQQIETGH